MTRPVDARPERILTHYVWKTVNHAKHVLDMQHSPTNLLLLAVWLVAMLGGDASLRERRPGSTLRTAFICGSRWDAKESGTTTSSSD